MKYLSSRPHLFCAETASLIFAEPIGLGRRVNDHDHAVRVQLLTITHWHYLAMGLLGRG